VLGVEWPEEWLEEWPEECKPPLCFAVTFSLPLTFSLLDVEWPEECKPPLCFAVSFFFARLAFCFFISLHSSQVSLNFSASLSEMSLTKLQDPTFGHALVIERRLR
jgi:hypothetical protein